MLQQYGQQPSGYGLGNTAGLDFGGGNPGGSGDLRAQSAGSAFGGNSGMTQGFQQVCSEAAVAVLISKNPASFSCPEGISSCRNMHGNDYLRCGAGLVMLSSLLQGFSQPMGGQNVPSTFAGGDLPVPQVLHVR